MPAALGLRGTPEDLEEAHQAAMLRYKPLPLALTGAVLISAVQNPLSGLIRSTWQKLVGADLKIESIDAEAGTIRCGAGGFVPQVSPFL